MVTGDEAGRKWKREKTKGFVSSSIYRRLWCLLNKPPPPFTTTDGSNALSIHTSSSGGGIIAEYSRIVAFVGDSLQPQPWLRRHQVRQLMQAVPTIEQEEE